jgi:hypothetical protein
MTQIRGDEIIIYEPYFLYGEKIIIEGNEVGGLLFALTSDLPTALE